MELFIFFLVWAGLSYWIGHVAETRGRSMAGYFLLSFFTSPLVGIIVVLVASDLKAEERKSTEQKREHELQLETIKALTGARSSPDAQEKPCPYCAEPIKLAAVKCKHCGSDLLAAWPHGGQPL